MRARRSSEKQLKALVTGGAGYIGSHTVLALLNAGHEVAVLDNLSTGHRDAVDARATFHDADVFADFEPIYAKERPDVVLHFAGSIRVDESVSRPEQYWLNNVVASLELITSLRIGRLRSAPIVFSSSASVYGAPNLERGRYPRLTEDSPTDPKSPYGDTKLTIERVLASYGRAYELPWIALRYFNAAGANVEAGLGERHDPETHLIPNLLRVAAGELPHFNLYGTDFPTFDGTAVRDFVHVDDLARAHVIAAERLVKERHEASGIFNLGTGVGHSVLEVIDAVTAVTEQSISVRSCARRDGDPPVLVADPSLAERVLDWRAEKSQLVTIVRDAWAAYRPCR